MLNKILITAIHLRGHKTPCKEYALGGEACHSVAMERQIVRAVVTEGTGVMTTERLPLASRKLHWRGWLDT